ncbi:Type IV pilus biogenesis protein PilM [Paraburkholderia caribensis MBA4]|uniref:Type IV pilus biogenesis protein PilM n=1 Tax=Paraburkholderia caribensis MBA4 TaxID=1323664 RepID=A0A0P0R789_9BURK|nr:pilus assembly protein PilM [Paraburkholderia caribensis]ALL63830.1 Type IV pilus biogenesis protein PilM [Paraburkholderia caribensis MBA4]
MALKDSLRMAMRRQAVGIDVGAQAVRIVALSGSARKMGPVRIECIALEPLAPGAMAGAEIVDRQAVARSLSEAFCRVPQQCMSAALRCAMAIPGSATFTAHLPINQVSGPRGSGASLEPTVLMEAERVAGIERHALAVDWYVDESPSHPGRVSIAATARAHLEARIESAAMAGVTLTTVDVEPHAALRALRHAATFELELHEPYAAIWIGSDGVYGWRLEGETIAEEIRYPSPEYSGVADALRDLAENNLNVCALVGGEIELLDGVSFSLADIGDVLGCSVLPFDCSSLSDGNVITDSELLHEPSFAVAFGLALRGIAQ